MVTINSYSATLTLAAGGFVDSSKLARGEASSLQRTIRGLVTPTESVGKQLDLLEKAFRQQAIEESTYNEVTKRLKATLVDQTAAIKAKADAERKDNQLIAEGERLTRSLLNAEEQHAQSLRRLKSLHDSQAIGTTTYNRAVAQANAQLSAFNAQFERSGPIVASKAKLLPQAVADGATAATRSIAGLAAGYFALSTAASVVRSSIQKAIDVEQSKTQFSVLTGSAQKAEEMLGKLRKLAVESPLTLSDTTNAARTLLSFNVAAQDVLPTLKMIGDVTGGNSERFKMMSLAFAQSAAAGRLMGQDLLQMINAGFNPLQEISLRTGRSLVQLKKEMEDGRISFAMVKEAFRSATDEGGRFHGMIQAIASTTGGAMQQAKGAVEMLQIQLGDSLSPVLRQISTDLMGLTDNTNQTKAAFDGLGTAVLGFYNFAKSEISLLPSLGRGLGFVGYAAGEAADVFNSYTLHNNLMATKTLEEARKIFEEAKTVDRTAYDAMIRKFQAQTIPAMLKDGTPPPYVIAIGEAVRKIREEEERLAKPDSLIPSKTAEDANTVDKLATKYQTMVNTLSAQIAKLKEGKAASLDMRAELAGFSDLQQKHIHSLATELEALEKRNKAEKERTAELKRQQQLSEKNEREAERIREGFRRPGEKLLKDLQDIERLRKAEALTPFEAERARREAIKDSTKDLKMESPQAIELGTQAAGDWLAKWQNQKNNTEAKTNQQILNKQVAMLAEQKETNRLLNKLNETQPRNRR